MKRRISFFVILIFFANSFCEDITFNTSFDFINLPVSARVAGGAFSLIGDKDNSLAVRTNPAMLAGINKTAVGIDFSPIIMDIYSGAVSGAIVLRNGIVLAPSLSYLSFGTIDAVDENGDDMQMQVAPFGLSIETAAAYKFYEKLSIGARLKFIHEQIATRTIYWDENVFSAIATDLGIFSFHNIFRYSAGFRNLGVAFEKSKVEESNDVKLPSSVFAAVGVAIDGEAKLNWFLECERYFHDYMFFRTGLEIPTQREVLIFRAGTTFTPDDIRHIFGTLRGNTKKAWEYSSGNWLLAAVGTTINARIAQNLLSLDIACQFRKDGIKPGFLFSGTMYF